MDHAEDLTVRMNVYMNSVECHENMFLVDGDWTVSSVVKLTDDKIDSVGYERLQSRLRLQKVRCPRKIDLYLSDCEQFYSLPNHDYQMIAHCKAMNYYYWFTVYRILPVIID